MSYQIQIKAGQNNVSLPDGHIYNENDIVTLTDEQYNKTTTSARQNTFTVLQVIADGGGGGGGGIAAESDPIAGPQIVTETARAQAAEAAKASTSALTSETSRATAAESAEATRAQAAEGAKATTSALTTETSRATAAEQAASTAAANEASRAQSAESAEATRAQAAEATNATSLTNHVNSTVAHSSDHITFDDSGLIIVKGANIKVALAAIDAKLAAPPSGVAGGGLSGNYPNPDVASAYLTDTHIAPAAAIAESKLALASDAPPSIPSRRVSQVRSVVGEWKTGAWGGALSFTTAPINAYAFCDPVLVAEAETWDQFAIRTGTTAGVGGAGVVVDFAVYADNGHGMPTGAPLATLMGVALNMAASTVTSGTLGTPLGLQPGLYHVAVGYRYTTAPTTAPTITSYAGGYIPPNFTNANANIALAPNVGYAFWNYAGAFGTSPAMQRTGGTRQAVAVHVLSRP